MRKLAILILTILVLCSCAESKKFRKQDGTVFEANPYGWANRNAQKVDGVVYDINGLNILWSIIGFETVVLLIYCTGWELFEPVYYVENDSTERQYGF